MNPQWHALFALRPDLVRAETFKDLAQLIGVECPDYFGPEYFEYCRLNMIPPPTPTSTSP